MYLTSYVHYNLSPPKLGLKATYQERAAPVTIFCKLFDKSQTKKELCGRTFVALSCGFQTWEKFRFLTTLSTVTARVISRQGAIGMLCLVTCGGVEGEGGVQLWEPWAPQGAPE